MNPKKILITGANGLLGQKLVKLIVDQGIHSIIATSRGENRMLLQEGYTYEVMDTTDAEQTKAVILKHKPDVVIHGAAMTNVDQCEVDKEEATIQNTTAVQHIVDACQLSGAFLVHVSTDFIFDGANGPYSEEAIPNPISHYGQTKLDAELIVQKSSISWAIARTVLVYGITAGLSRSNIILWVKDSLEKGKKIQVVTDQLRSPTLAEDLAMGCLLIAEQESKGIFNISGKDLLTPYEMAIKTAAYFQLDQSLIEATDGSKFQQTAKRPLKTGFDISKAQQILGYQPHSFEEGIALLHSQLN